MFNELQIKLRKHLKSYTTWNASWDEDGIININPIFIIFKNINNKQLNSIEEMVDFINEEFLTEFICMELAKGINDNVWEGYCERDTCCYCTPKEVALEMSGKRGFLFTRRYL